ncbi:hypothetical protein TNCV_2945241 [Trichonephila clavipes]|nr:hypothetical protein TNCV_2945241 [Trichonephila clavipes]
MYSARTAGGTLNSPLASSPLVRGGKPPPPPGCSPSKLGGIEPNRSAICMVLKATENGRHIASSLPR